MGWVIILAICYAPIIYTINRRLSKLESRLEEIESKLAKLEK